MVLYNHKGGNHHISIHAPREGSDVIQFTNDSNQTDFYPRSPRGERPEFLLDFDR